MRKCKRCGNDVTSKHKHVVYCSTKCSNIASSKRRMKRVDLVCKNCETTFNVTPSDIKYRGGIKFCSQKCSGEYRVKTGGKWVNVNCDNCGLENKKLKSRIKDKNFCNRVCQIKYRKDNPIKKDGFWYENGYRVLYAGNGKGIKEHIKIIQDSIGRELRKGEVVHHINGIRDDNRIENLKLMTSSEHSRLHRMQDIENGIPCVKHRH